MERLQEALKRAREQRAEAGALPPPGAMVPSHDGIEGQPPAPSAAAPVQLEAAWAAVPEFVPSPRIMRKNRLVAFFPGPEASSFDILRTKIIQQAKSKSARRIVVTSPSAGCGKTTTTLNLALSLARQADLRILVVDIDLRRPALGASLGLQEPHQFSQALSQETPVDEHLVRIGSNLIIASNTMPVSNPSELLQSKAARDTLTELDTRFKPDIVLFDALPVLASDDTIGFLEYCDAALIVAAAELTSIEELDVTEAEVSGMAPVLGVVLNKCRYTNTNYDYY